MRARKIMRKKNLLLARDVESLKPYICNVGEEITQRLERGDNGFLEIPQGFQLSYGLDQFYPNTTSRNCSVAAGFDDMMVSPAFLGDVILNFRTYPIRIHSKKYIGKDGKHLTWDEVQDGKPHEVIESFSGHGYDDQTEITWEDLTQWSGSQNKIIECTTLTKLPRRVFTFSKKNLVQAVKANQSPFTTHVCINFMNYVDNDLYGKMDKSDLLNSEKAMEWMQEYVMPLKIECKFELLLIGTSEHSDKVIEWFPLT